MSEPLKKPHTPAYIHLKKVALELTADYEKAVRQHSPETVGDVMNSCRRAWDDAIRHVISARGLNQGGGTIRAAKRRLKAKNLLTFLDEKRMKEEKAA